MFTRDIGPAILQRMLRLPGGATVLGLVHFLEERRFIYAYADRVAIAGTVRDWLFDHDRLVWFDTKFQTWRLRDHVREQLEAKKAKEVKA